MYNPYTSRNVIRTPDLFFGRIGELNRLYALLTNGQSVSVVGDRRIGKSSLLAMAARPFTQSRFPHFDFAHHLFVVIDLQGCRLREPDAILEHWWRQAARQGNGRFSTPPPHPITPEAFEDAIYQFNRQKGRLVFLLDEFDCISLNEQLDPAFFSFLRYLATNYDLAFVTASHRRLGTLCHAGIVDSPFFNIFALIGLGGLDETAVHDLITIPSLRAGYPLANHAGWVREMAGTQPLFLQILCFYLLETARRGAVNRAGALAQFRQEAADHFAYAWEHAKEATRQNWLDNLANGRTSHYLMTSQVFRDFVAGKRAVPPPTPIRTADVEAGLENLWRPAELAQNPLAQSAQVTTHLAQHNLADTPANRGKSLHELLKAAIDTLRHGRTPDQNNSQWRSWYILHHKYEKEQSNRQIYTRLNLSERTFYRERKAAIAAVTAVLRSQFTIHNS